MKKFILKILFFFFVCCILGEAIVRFQKLTPDIPIRYIDDNGIQKYIINQSGYYTKSNTKWHVNDFGWLGVCDTSKNKKITIIGDSFIENIMNSIQCNQASFLKNNFEEYSFFEASRSGMTFIEDLFVANSLNYLKPAYKLIYVGTEDFYESIADINRYDDRLQVDLSKNKILKGNLKNTNLKKVLYNIKLFYYLWLRFPINFHLNEKITNSSSNDINNNSDNFIEDLFQFCQQYNTPNTILIFHPSTKKEIIELAKKYKYNYLVLICKNESDWKINSADIHWSCFGHQEVSKQVSTYLIDSIQVQ